MTYRYARRPVRARCWWIIGLIALAACDRPRNHAPAASIGAGESARAAAPDTVVRRVVRMARRASALQRVTQQLRVTRALEPLDSPLVVRVYDRRGDEIANVPVRWTVVSAGDGAELRVVNAATDTAGLSRATFVPGATADTQHVFAEVDSVGRIDFAVVVPATALRVRLPRADLWSGENAIVSAELRDVAGRELQGGYVSWASSDTSVLRLRSADASHGEVTAIAAGDAAVVAWIGDGKVQGSARTLVRPVIAGEFVTIDGRPAPPMRVELRSEGIREPLTVTTGRFTARVALEPEASVEIVASPLADSSLFHVVDVRVHRQRNLQNLRIALVPTRWRIDAGTYAGQEVAIDAARAVQRTGRGASFWRLVPLSGTAPRRLLGWAESALPLSVAFDRAHSIEPITGADSVAFWQTADRMQRDLGMRLFVPADIGDTTRRDVVPVQISAQSSEGHTSVSWAQEGNASDGVVLFRRAATLRDAHVVTHELLHLIGFGHTFGWPTVSLPAGGTESSLTVADVAYVQLAMRLRRLQRETGALPGLPVAAP